MSVQMIGVDDKIKKNLSVIKAEIEAERGYKLSWKQLLAELIKLYEETK